MFLFLSVLLVFAPCLTGCTENGGAAAGQDGEAARETASAASIPEFTSFSELNGKRVSMLTGVPFEELVKSKVPNVGAFSYYNTIPDLVMALRSDRTDAILLNNAVSTLAVNRNPDTVQLPENLKDAVFGIAFDKGAGERDAWQEAFDSITEEEKQAAWEKWTGSDESLKILPGQDWPGLNGTVTVAAADSVEPMSYVGEGGEIKGFDIEMILLMAKRMDVHVEFTGMDFSAVLSYVESGKALIGTGSIIVTPEREETVDFVEYWPTAFVLVVRNIRAENIDKEGSDLLADLEEADETESGFFASVLESLEKTFLREDRWKLFLFGITTTLLITMLSIVFGTLLGFAVFMLCRGGSRAANMITHFFVWLVRGMPVVVLLMIIYYIIFGKVRISGTVVSVIGFTFVFGASVYSLLKSGSASVDCGQEEAALSLGYKETKAFFRVILPQAMPYFMSGYKGEITALIKATAVVGYIAVQDLTKIADIVRSRTYDAFFPLISTAAIYFILAAILTFFANQIEIHIDPKRRKKKPLLKGVRLE